MVKKCILDEDKFCNECGDCDFCDLNPFKKCDNCGRCLEDGDKEYRELKIDSVVLPGQSHKKYND